MFLVKSATESISPQFDPHRPGRYSAHLLTDGVQICAIADFDDKFVVNMVDDVAVGQRPHGVAQDVPAGYVLAEFRLVALDARPALGVVHARLRGLWLFFTRKNAVIL